VSTQTETELAAAALCHLAGLLPASSARGPQVTITPAGELIIEVSERCLDDLARGSVRRWLSVLESTAAEQPHHVQCEGRTYYQGTGRYGAVPVTVRARMYGRQSTDTRAGQEALA
jgi:hypothetical protein